MALVDLSSFRSQFSADWNHILEGIENQGFIDQITIELAQPALGRTAWLRFLEWREMFDKVEQTVLTQEYNQKIRPLNDQIEQNNGKYRHLFAPSRMKILWTNIKMKQDKDYRYPSKGWFICKLLNEEPNFEYGFFEVKRGTCGFNNCEAGGSYGTFYVGTWPEVYQYALTDKHRGILEEVGFSIVDKLV